jgi:hypothetical protein
MSGVAGRGDAGIGSAVVVREERVGGVDAYPALLVAFNPGQGGEMETGDETNQETREGDLERVFVLFREFSADIVKDGCKWRVVIVIVTRKHSIERAVMGCPERDPV